MKLTTESKIDTQKLNILPVIDSDLTEIHRFMSNPNLTRLMLSLKTPKTIEDTKTIFNNLKTFGIRSHLWALRLKNTDRVVGVIHFFLAKLDQGEIHYILAEEFWNQGLMTEAVNAVLDWANNSYPQLQKVSSNTAGVNIGSRRVLEKCGFQVVNRRYVRWQKFYPHFIDVIDYELNLSKLSKR